MNVWLPAESATHASITPVAVGGHAKGTPAILPVTYNDVIPLAFAQ
jgi:hypothetical protein